MGARKKRMNISYRRLTLADYPRVVEICKATPNDWVPKKYSRWMNDPEINNVYGIEVENEKGEKVLVGFGNFMSVHGTKFDYVWWGGLRVHKEFQNKGLGKWGLEAGSIINFGTKARYSTLSNIIRKFGKGKEVSAFENQIFFLEMPLWEVKVKSPIEEYFPPTQPSEDLALAQISPYEYLALVKQLSEGARERLLKKDIICIGRGFFADFDDLKTVLYQYPDVRFWILHDKEKNIVSLSVIAEVEGTQYSSFYMTLYDTGNQQSAFLHIQNAKKLSEEKGFEFVNYQIIGEGAKFMTSKPNSVTSCFEFDLSEPKLKAAL
eukprot:TRINITY_DN89_c0_g1_i1.p1 TRINITY_DN89_c0_g1~~TRINITY_DN89_c0_g1_i1.p1  ORF type:complete len:321 (+),score=54.05 TRINITY_DN89_c0_g1_i1:215-1177(+)